MARINITFAIISMFIFTGCVRISGNSPIVYKKGKQFFYELIELDSIKDTVFKTDVELRILAGTANSGQIKSEYIKYDIGKNGKYKSLSNITGIIENNDEVWIHPYFYFSLPNKEILHMAPFPNMQFNKKIGDDWYGGQYPGHAHFGLSVPNNHPNAASFWHYKLDSIEELKFRDENIEVYKILATGKVRSLDSKDKYRCIFYWNKNLGFVNLKYENLLDDRIVELILKEVI